MDNQEQWEWIIKVIPKEETQTRGYMFDVYVRFLEDEENVDWHKQLDSFELLDLLSAFSQEISKDGVNINVYAYYHGDEQLIRFYSELMEAFNGDSFHMEYEWG